MGQIRLMQPHASIPFCLACTVSKVWPGIAIINSNLSVGVKVEHNQKDCPHSRKCAQSCTLPTNSHHLLETAELSTKHASINLVAIKPLKAGTF